MKKQLPLLWALCGLLVVAATGVRADEYRGPGTGLYITPGLVVYEAPDDLGITDDRSVGFGGIFGIGLSERFAFRNNGQSS